MNWNFLGLRILPFLLIIGFSYRCYLNSEIIINFYHDIQFIIWVTFTYLIIDLLFYRKIDKEDIELKKRTISKENIKHVTNLWDELDKIKKGSD